MQSHYVMLAAIAAIVLLTASSCSAAEPVKLGTRLELFVDNALIDQMKGVSLRLHHPIPREEVAKLDAPWEGYGSAYAAVMKDGDTYRMYYRGGFETGREVTCMMESKDGIRWTRPNLGLFEFNGSKENNIVYIGTRGKAYWESHNFMAFKDENPAAPPDQKYKAVGLGRYVTESGDDERALVAMVSPDAIHWKPLRKEAIITFGAFDSQNVVFWDVNRNEYVCYFRVGYKGVRAVSRTTSKDFINWNPPEHLDHGDSVPEQFYTNAITPYFRDPYWYIGLPMRFVPERKTAGAEKRETDGLSDAVLLTSRDGLKFDRTFMEAFIRPGLDPGNWGHAHANQTPNWGIVPNSAEEMSVYWLQHYGEAPVIRRGTLRTDGFASVNAPYAGGEFTTKPLTFAGKQLVINFATSAVGSVRVEIQDAEGKPIPGYALADCPETWGDEIERAVEWKSGSDVSALAGKTVRLRFVMMDADLYSIRFR